MSDSQLPDAELEVLACLWKYGQLTARAVRERMIDYRPMTHAAVSTLLKRLQEKDLVAREKGPVGKAFLYRARGNPRKTYRRIVGDLIERVFSGNGMALISTLLEAHPPSADELDQLQQLLNGYREEKDPATGCNPEMAKMMMLMPVIFTFMFVNFASGLVLYFFVNNMLQMAQQHFINKGNS